MPDGSALDLSLAQVWLGVLRGVEENGLPLIEIDGRVRAARSLVALAGVPMGSTVALATIEGGPDRLLILGILCPPEKVADVDGRREIVGEREVVLRCGPASIRLTADGRVTIRGTRILSRADGSNRVQGACVELN